MANRDEESGEFVQTYSEEDFIAALKDLDGSGSTQEIADAVGCAYRTAHQKLRHLAGKNRVTKRKVGRAFLWMLTEESQI